MKITALIENTSCSDALCTEHGLSFFIECAGKKLLFDTGMSSAFAENAKTLGIDITQAELAVISHGHYDHGGGIRAFLELNKTAPVYLREAAFDKHFSQRPDELFYIGLDGSLLPNGRIIFTEPVCVIDDNLSLFSEVPHYEPLYSSSKTQLEELNGQIVQDRFIHEQNMVLREGSTLVLLAGCAHSGILNILTRFRELYERDPDVVIGGFHLMVPNLGKSIPDEDIDALAEKLKTMKNTRFYTCHCTGKHAYERLKETLGEQISYIYTGMTIEH
ncbi:MAG: MBL fold metallo-hydrolase [Candidatus Heteroscillospira sp.]|jgi:7,8-dihydropterin-6-yl-methyl-4-(beta-D-ribofuranosyl)aminobenzene 5'-phosphate synthase